MILEIQQKAYRDSTDLLFSSLNRRLDEQCKLINDLKYSLEFTQDETRTLKTDFEKLKKESDEQKKTIEHQRETIEILRKKQDSQEDYSRRKNIRIDGLEDDMKENREQTQVKIQKLIKEKLGLERISIDTAHRLSRKAATTVNVPRTIIARLSTDLDRDEIMKKTNRLKGSGIFINEDYSEATAKIRRELQPQLRTARDSGKLAFIRGRQLVVRDRPKRHNGSAMHISDNHTPPRSVSSLVQRFTPEPQAASIESPPPSPVQQKKKKKDNSKLEVTENKRKLRNS